MQEGDAEPDPDFDVLAFYPPAQEKIRNDAPETAAERDRLKEVNQDLLEACLAYQDEMEITDVDQRDMDMVDRKMQAAIAKAEAK